MMKTLDIIVTVLLVIGAINWGLVGVFGFNIVTALFGEATALTRVFYTVVGLCGIFEAFNFSIGFEALHHRWCDLPTAARR